MVLVEPNREGYIKVNTADIYFRVYGNNQRTVIFLHGNGEDWHVFEKQINPISKHFKVVTVDSRGHGSSSFGTVPLSLEVMADDVAEVMEELNIFRAVIVGFSDGGNIGIQFALKYPNRVEKLVVAGANLYPSGLKQVVFLPLLLKYLIYLLLAIFNKGYRKKLQILGLMVHEPNIDPNDLQSISMPTLILAGEKDMIKVDHTRLIASSIVNSQLQIIPNTNHFIFAMAADKVNVMILSFIYN